LVVVKKSWLDKQRENVPTMLNYKIHVDNESLFNTPPCLPVYVVGRTLKWIMRQGGLEAINENNIRKANLLYDFFDANSDFYKPRVKNKEDRSYMNICCNLPTKELEEKFVAEAKSRMQMANLKGHRSIGGVRVSTYNACPIEWIEKLIGFMEVFMQENK
jgi:phosphoserine aminotransferase